VRVIKFGIGDFVLIAIYKYIIDGCVRGAARRLDLTLIRRRRVVCGKKSVILEKYLIVKC
jgi:hypothetical protein